MALLKELYLRLGWLTRRSRFYAELSEEMQFHMAERARELQQTGLSANEALAQARREFGSSLKAAENTGGEWHVRWIEELVSDIGYAARAMRRNPGLAVTAIVCLALGIGANTTIFNITTSFLFSQPSCRNPSSLIAIREGGNSGSPLADYKFLRAAHLFDGLAGINVERELNWRDGGQTKRLYAGFVTDDYFTTLGIPLLLGRGIGGGETNTAVLSYRLWRQSFGEDPAVLGRKAVLDGRLYEIVGVLPADHRGVAGFGLSPDIYTPVIHDDDFVKFYARLPEGITTPIARARLVSVFEQLDRIHPKEDWKRANQVQVTGVTGFEILNQEIPGAVTAFFIMLLIVVNLVLLIACTNVANLLLARAAGRSQELAIRLSLGASRGRIVRHLLAESLLLSVLGCALGLSINFGMAKPIGNIVLPVPIPIHIVLSADSRLLWYSVCLTLASAIVCGLLPALKAVRKDINRTLKNEQRQSVSTWNLRSLLVTGQLAISILLLATGFLFVHNLLRASSIKPGFDIDHTIWAYMRLAPDKYSDADQAKQLSLVHSALEQLRAVPGVQAAAITRRVPLNDNCVIGTGLRTQTSPHPMQVMYQCNNVGPDYFRTTGIRLLAGREFNADDRQGSPLVAIVNETFARTVFGDRNPVGQTVTIDITAKKPRLIVGLVSDSKYFMLNEKQRLALYEPYFASSEPINLHFLLRTANAPAGHLKIVTDLLGRLDPTAAIEAKSMSRSLSLALLPSRAGAWMLGSIGILGLLLAAIGLYGVLLYSVEHRTREIGLRVALGAMPWDVLRMICGYSLAMAGAGTFAGLTLAVLIMRPLALFLVPGVSPFDMSTFLAVFLVLAVVATLATLVPALRALRVDPIVALRYD